MRRGRESNPRIEVLQTPTLPLGYPAGKKSIIKRTHFVSTQCNSEFDVGRSTSDVRRSFRFTYDFTFS